MMLSPTPDQARSRTWAVIDLGAIAHNVQVLRGRIPPRTAFMAVVKADAYGHGAAPVAEAALAAGASWLGVATAEEVLELRAAGIAARTLILGPVPADWLPAVARDCMITLADHASLDVLHGLPGPHRPRVHIKIDTGMTRLGVAVDELPALLAAIDPARIVVEGVYTHLACADDSDPSMTRAQLTTFARAAELVRARFPGAICHAAASAGVLGHPEAALDLVRIGIALYGVAPAPHLSVPLRPVMTLSSRVIRTRHVAAGTPVSYGATYRPQRATTIATVPVGYADGYPRALSNAGVMRIGGQRHPIAGRVCMDFTMLDVGDAPVREGDEVTVFGPWLPAAEVAASAGTIAYELFCRVGPRVPRLFVREGRVVAVAIGSQDLRAVEVGRRGLEVR